MRRKVLCIAENVASNNRCSRARSFNEAKGTKVDVGMGSEWFQSSCTRGDNDEEKLCPLMCLAAVGPSRPS